MTPRAKLIEVLHRLKLFKGPITWYKDGEDITLPSYKRAMLEEQSSENKV